MRGVGTRAWLRLMGALLLPLVSMAIVPFYDTSEPRYAEIARLMAQSGDWITPWFSPGVPFWGKPPLSFWAQALCMRLFGFTEFAARLPAWICLLLSDGILIAGLRPMKGLRVAVLAATIYSTCTLVYICSGAVLTDPFLALGTTLSLVSFAAAVHGRIAPAEAQAPARPPLSGASGKSARHWRPYGFFIGIGIGLLAKGPLAAVLIFAPILTWHALNRKTVSLRAALPWGKGLLLAAGLSLPWYVLAELRTPGFLNYFIVGEHFRRFLDPGWTGDLYGSAHQRAHGTIWLYWLLATFPWGLWALAILAGAFRSPGLRAALKKTARDPLFGYWLAAALSAPVFFTFSSNILWTYVLPSLAGFSVLIAISAAELDSRPGRGGTALSAAAAIVPACVLAFSAIVCASPDLLNTERGLVRYAMRQHGPALALLYFSELPFSARFYSAGQARRITEGELGKALECSSSFFLAVPKQSRKIVSDMLREPLGELYANKRYILIKIPGPKSCGGHIAGKRMLAKAAASAG